MDHFRLTVPPIPNNQAFLPVEKRIKHGKDTPFVAFGILIIIINNWPEDELNNEQEKKVNTKEEIMIGFYSRKKLQEVFNSKKEE